MRVSGRFASFALASLGMLVLSFNGCGGTASSIPVSVVAAGPPAPPAVADPAPPAGNPAPPTPAPIEAAPAQPVAEPEPAAPAGGEPEPAPVAPAEPAAEPQAGGALKGESPFPRRLEAPEFPRNMTW